MGIRIVTDSTSEISQAEAEALGIDVVPLKTCFGDRAYLDGIEITAMEFYARLARAKELPTTSQPSPEDFRRVFERARLAGDEVVAICMARLLSGTCQSAELAREALGGEGIHIIDSDTATVSLQLLVWRAIELRDAGASAADVAAAIEREKRSVYLLAAIDTLEYLHKGGRLSKASSVTGTLLKVKPLISLHAGVISVVGKSLGLRKAYAAVLKKAQELGGIDFSRPYAIGHTGGREHFRPFEEYCLRSFAEQGAGDGGASGGRRGGVPAGSAAGRLITAQVGSVVGTHAGPGAVALAFFSQA